MAITDLFAKIVYPTGAGTDLPILVVMHGFTLGARSFAQETLNRFADYGLFVIAVGMRGRDYASGDQDCSARELQDIVDAIAYVRATAPYSAYVSQTKAAVVGYSGGGGNALALACKYPDLFTVIVSHFGMSDYGDWYTNGPVAYHDELEAWVGGTPAAVPDAYAARKSVDAICNYTGGYIYVYHDEDDASVAVTHSQAIETALNAGGLSNHSVNISTAVSEVRWTHGYPEDVPDLITAEPTWSAAVVSGTPWTVPASGTATVIGHLITKRFSIWLGGLTEAAVGAGLDEVATVVYDTATGEYTVTPVTGAMDVFIKQGELTAAQNIAGATLLTVA